MGSCIDVLMIEDDGADAYLLESLLQKEPVTATQLQLERSRSVAEGLDHLAMHHVDSVLLDLNLPDSRGYATVERIRDRAPDAFGFLMCDFLDLACDSNTDAADTWPARSTLSETRRNTHTHKR